MYRILLLEGFDFTGNDGVRGSMFVTPNKASEPLLCTRPFISNVIALSSTTSDPASAPPFENQ